MQIIWGSGTWTCHQFDGVGLKTLQIAPLILIQIELMLTCLQVTLLVSFTHNIAVM